MTPSISFEPPGPGHWELDTSHHGRRPLSGYLRDATMRAVESGMAELFETWGLPIARIDTRLVNGCAYGRVVAVGEGSGPSSVPPHPVVWLFARLHPVLRRRNKRASEAFDRRLWREQIDSWFAMDRPAVVARNRALQAVELSTLDDETLVAHTDEVLAQFEEQAQRNMATHGADGIPVGDFLAHCEQWGISSTEAASLLTGSSSATLDPARQLTRLAPLVQAPGLRSVDDVRALGPTARTIVDDWLADYGWRLLTSDDIDGVTLAEQPAVQLRVLLSATELEAPQPPNPAPCRARVPVEHRSLFDELLEEARYGQQHRDDNVGVRWNWTAGLVRRAVLHAGERLVERGSLQLADHAIELSPSELRARLIDGSGEGPTVIAERANWRLRVEDASPPLSLGPPEPPPPLDAFPDAMARSTRAMLAVLDALDRRHDRPALHGTGIGHRSYTGVARLMTAADDLDRIEPGDVIVAAFTGPAYNAILPLAGALVVEEGGPMSHAAIVAREFALPAVIGATEATAHITDGQLITVCPTNGTVRVDPVGAGAGS